jgi:hypothetical protein
MPVMTPPVARPDVAKLEAQAASDLVKGLNQALYWARDVLAICAYLRAVEGERDSWRHVAFNALDALGFIGPEQDAGGPT